MKPSPLETYLLQHAQALASKRDQEKHWVVINHFGSFRKHVNDIGRIASWNRRVCYG